MQLSKTFLTLCFHSKLRLLVLCSCSANIRRLVLAGGVFCKAAEKNYSPIEGEATAIEKGLKDTKFYTLGCQKLLVATDHKPLVGILGDKNLVDIDSMIHRIDF